MKKKKLGYLIFCCVFFIGCLLPFVMMPFEKTTISENRNMSELPTSFDKDYFNKLSDYVSDNFAGRSLLIEVNNLIKYKAFKTPGDDQVILGKDGWLFFDETLKDYTGITFEESKIAAIADNLLDVQEYIIKKGKTPIIMLVPNKNTIYYEYMPAKYKRTKDKTNLILLQDALKERNVNYIDVRSILLEAKKSDEVYLHQDTHWNNTGARAVLNQLFKELEVDFSFNLQDYTIEKSHEADLSKILFPAKSGLENQRIYKKESDYSFVKRMRSLDDLNISTVNEAGVGKNILIYRDSFGRAMVDYCSQVFNNATYNRSTPYDLSVMEQCECDYVVIEIVERNIKDLGDIIIPE